MHILACENALQKQQEKLNALIHKLDRVYGDIEQKRLEAEWTQAKKVYDQLAKCNDGAQYFLNPRQNMAVVAMILWSIPEPDEP